MTWIYKMPNSFLNLEFQRSQYMNVRKLFKGGNYSMAEMRKYGMYIQHMLYLTSTDLKLTKCTVKKLSPSFIALASSWSCVTRSFSITMAVFLAGKLCGKEGVILNKNSNQPLSISKSPVASLINNISLLFTKKVQGIHQI